MQTEPTHCKHGMKMGDDCQRCRDYVDGAINVLGRRLPVQLNGVAGGQGRSARGIRSDGWVLILWALALAALVVGFLVMR